MRPTLFHIWGVDVPSFFFMIMIASLVGTFVAIQFAKKDKLSEVVILDMGIIAVIASVLGSRIFHILVEAPDYYWEDPIRVFYFWQGGFVSLGAFIGTISGWIIYCKVKKIDMLRYLDIGALIVPFVIFFVRVGCFLNGCCYGKACSLPWCISYTSPGSVAHYYMGSALIHPTQVYFMLNAMVMFLVMLLVRKYGSFKGQLSAVFLMYYGITRFFIEFFRGDEDRGVYFDGAISTGQVVMIVSYVVGVILYFYFKKRAKA